MTIVVLPCISIPDLRASAPPMLATRFTIDGSNELENHLASTCNRVLAGVQSIVSSRNLEALILGGGYGRGEGGVLKSKTGDQPYNDLDFYVCLRGNRFYNERCYQAPLHQLAERLSPDAHVEVEFKVFSLSQLRHAAPSMFYYDLVTSHRWLWGDESLLVGCEHHRDPRRIPLSEATRLLMNRCSGLLFAREKLKREPFTAEDADFVGRNLAKAKLAFGDAVLTAFGQYNWSCLKRREQVQRLSATQALPWFPDLLRHHADGVAFKLHPHLAVPEVEALQLELQELIEFGLRLWLWVESARLGCPFRSASDYALSTVNKWPDPKSWWNRFVNAFFFGPVAFFHRRSHRHPRERVLNALALLLWEPGVPNSQEMRWLQSQLALSDGDSRNLVNAYQALWRCLN